jgi:hypothetical protein
MRKLSRTLFGAFFLANSRGVFESLGDPVYRSHAFVREITPDHAAGLSDVGEDSHEVMQFNTDFLIIDNDARTSGGRKSEIGCMHARGKGGLRPPYC